MAAARETWEEVDTLPVERLSLAPASTAPQSKDDDTPTAREPSERPTATGRAGIAGGQKAAVQPPSAPKPAQSPTFVDNAVRDALMSPKVRLTVVRFEADIEEFVSDPDQKVLTFPGELTSYQRLLAHRVAQHYGLETTTIDAGEDQVRVKAIKGPNTRRPQVKLASINNSNSNHSASTTQRWQSTGEGGGQNSGSAGDSKAGQQGGAAGVKLLTSLKPASRSPAANGPGAAAAQRAPDKSYKERQQDYDKARSRLFANGPDSGPSSGAAVGVAVAGRGRGAPPINKAPSPTGRDPTSSTALRPSPTGNRRHGDAGADQKAVFRNRDEEMRDPDFQRDPGRFQPNFAPGYMDPSQQGSVYIQRAYNSEFPSLPGAGPVPMKGPMPPPGLPAGVPTISSAHSLGMSYPSMPLIGPQMVPMAPDGTFLTPNGMPGYATHMHVPYAVFPGMGPGGMPIPHMQGTVLVPGQMPYGMPYHPGAYGMHHARPGGMDGLSMPPMASLGMMPPGAVPMYPGYQHHQGNMPMPGPATPRPSLGPPDRPGGRGRGYSPHPSGPHPASHRQGSSGSVAPLQKAASTSVPPPSAPLSAPPPSSSAPATPSSKAQ